MESSEAIRRIFWRHRWLLIVLIILPAAAAALYFEHKPVMYTATAQVQGQNATPDAATQVQAIQGRVSAVATDPATVRKAMSTAGVSGNATQVARHQVTVKPLGSSAVMSVTVTEPARSAALKLAGALATTVATQIDELGTTNNPALAKLNASTAKLTVERNALNAELKAAEAHGESTSSINVQYLLTELSSVEQQLSSSVQSAQQLLASNSTGAAVVAMPAFTTGASRHAAEYGALAGLLGLVIGLLIATIRESVRPTVAEPSAGARELGTVLLGNAGARDGEITGADDDLAARLDLAAQRLGVHTAVLAGPVSPACLRALAGRISAELPSGKASGGTAAHTTRAGIPAPSLAGTGEHGGHVRRAGSLQANGGPSGNGGLPAVRDLRGFGPEGSALDGEAGRPAIPGGSGHPLPAGRAGTRRAVALPDASLEGDQGDAALVAVLPPFAPHRTLDRITDLGVTTGWPVLGVIGLRRAGPSARPAQPGTHTASGDGNPVPDDTIEMGAAT